MRLTNYIVKVNRIFIRWILLFVVLLILSIPFEYNYLHINFLTSFFEGLVVKISELVLGDVSSYTLTFQSDSTGLYLNILIVFLFYLVRV